MDNETREQRFWLGLLYAALTGYSAAAATVAGYVALTWNQPNRGWILSVVIFSLAATIDSYRRRHVFVTSQYRSWLFAGWNMASFGFVVLVCSMDGGINSPIMYFYILPMLYQAIGFPLKPVLVSGFTGLIGFTLLVVFNPGRDYGPTQMIQFMALNIGWLLAIIGAVNRNRQTVAMNELRERLETLATTDELTGCLNQQAFKAALSHEIARAARYRHVLSLLLIDVDHFKQINDHHGHLKGDAVLRQVGSILRQSARGADIAGRPGGDELALLAPEIDSTAACTLAERIQERVKTQTLDIEITLSIGVCATIPDTDNVTTLFERADLALYRAKRRGRNQVANWHDLNKVEQDDNQDTPAA